LNDTKRGRNCTAVKARVISTSKVEREERVLEEEVGMVKREREGIFKRRVFLGGEAVFIDNASEVCRFKNPILRDNTTEFWSV